MDFLYMLESIRVPILNEFMLLITNLGDEITFLVIALVLFWCVDKRSGYFLLSVGFIGTLANQFMKLLFRIPRPWVIDENFTILEEAREAASGYSFPSGHTQSSVGTFGAIASITNRKSVRFAAVAVAILVPFSRMYIGVHTPLDVLVAAFMAIGLIYLLKPIVFESSGRFLPVLLFTMAALAIAFLIYVECNSFPVDIDQHNLASGIKNAYTLLGAVLGLMVVYYVDKKYINFSTSAVWWAQILKVFCGLLLVLAVKSGLKSPINFVFGTSVGTAVRYFLIVIVAGAVWPLSFRWFSNLGKKV